MLVRRLFSGVRETARLEGEVLARLGLVTEPVTKASPASLGMLRRVLVTDGGRIELTVDTFVPGYPDGEELRRRCIDKLSELTWVQQTHVQLTCSGSSLNSGSNTGLGEVKHVVAVSSCKGGVGKSTVATNLAYALSRLGLRVGLLDADIYGPSIPMMVNPDDPEAIIRRSPRNSSFVLPLEAEGVKVLSFGHVNPRAGVVGAGGQGAAVVRGPVASRVITQLIASTDWGVLDYLVISSLPYLTLKRKLS